MAKNKKKIVVIGLDGATWNLLKPWAMEGTLDTIRRLMETGVYGELESTIPPVTCPAWKSYSTGKNPGKLGVFFFFSLDREKKRVITNSPMDIKEDEIWDCLGRRGLKCGVINMPYTYPKKINGFIIAGMPSEDHDFTYPPLLEKELKAMGYRVNPKIMLTRENLQKKVDVMKDTMSSRFRVAEKYIGNMDFLHITIYHIDLLQHFLWNDPTLKEYWEHVDCEMGEFMKKVSDEDYVFVISDHGFTGMDHTFYINNWLIQQGYLKLKRKKVTPPAETLLRIVDKLSLLWLVYLLIPKKARINLFMKKTFDFMGVVDWDNTKAVEIGWGAGVIYVNADGIERESIKKKLKDELENLRGPKKGDRVLKVFDKESVYTGKFFEKAPDLIIVPNPGYQLWQTIGEGLWGDCPFGHVAFHDMQGIFLAYGPGIKKGTKIQNAKIYDIAPTILHIFDVPIPKDMDGRVLKEIFEDDSKLAKRPIGYEEVEEKERIKEKIRDLKTLRRM